MAFSRAFFKCGFSDSDSLFCFQSIYLVNLALEKLEIYGFNKRELLLKDFYAIAETEQITVLEMDVPTSFYFSASAKSFIVLKKNLRGLKKTFSAFHELAHHFLHGGGSGENAFFFGLMESKAEFEADALATIAIVPKKSLFDYEFLEDHPNRYARNLFRNRQKLEFLYGL